MKIYKIWFLNGLLCTGTAFYFKDIGWMNCAIQVWVATILFFINEK